MTEDDAKTKWCPFTRMGLNAGAGGVAVNRSLEPVDEPSRRDAPYSVYDETRCIGSGCMMWRTKWKWVNHPGGAAAIPEGHYEPDREEGFCGLAGAAGGITP
jgi:hypothetical protein